MLEKVLATRIEGKSITDYLAELVERNDRQEIEIERGKLAVSAVKQINNHCRLILDAQKFETRCMAEAMESQQTA